MLNCKESQAVYVRQNVLEKLIKDICVRFPVKSKVNRATLSRQIMEWIKKCCEVKACTQIIDCRRSGRLLVAVFSS
jgi:hypothetical protein